MLMSIGAALHGSVRSVLTRRTGIFEYAIALCSKLVF